MVRNLFQTITEGGASASSFQVPEFRDRLDFQEAVFKYQRTLKLTLLVELVNCKLHGKAWLSRRTGNGNGGAYIKTLNKTPVRSIT